jgi:hypothetical protein
MSFAVLSNDGAKGLADLNAQIRIGANGVSETPRRSESQVKAY